MCATGPSGPVAPQNLLGDHMMQLLLAVLRRIVTSGHLVIIGPDGARHEVGSVSGSPIVIKLNDRKTVWDLIINPQLSLGEAYMDGRLTVEEGDIADLLCLLTRNLGTGFGGGHLNLLAQIRYLLRGGMQRNGLPRSRRNVAHHYDLSADFYGLFLDRDQQYSCAFFENPSDTLEVAQLNKKRRIAAKLAMQRGMSVLDIGSGWGGLGLYLAEECGANVRGITLSTEQLSVARNRADKAGLSSKVDFALEDYRQTQGSFDRVVSVGMLEHVGVKHYNVYFQKIASLLSDNGVAMVHSIGRSDGPGVTNAWIDKYIFPGGYTPALSEILPAIERAGLIVTDIEVLRLHYAMTLSEWRKRFNFNREKAVKLYDERFCRMWEFYLAASEMAFRWQGNVVFQVQVARRVDALPLTRDYMTPALRRDKGSRLAVAAAAQ